MGYLLKTEDDYRLCYGEPTRPYVITSNDSYFCASEYQKMCNEEKEAEAHALMDADNFPIDSWADVYQNDKGIIVSSDIAEYLLQGEELKADEFIELKLAI